jgi:hypothetical protein
LASPGAGVDVMTDEAAAGGTTAADVEAVVAGALAMRASSALSASALVKRIRD